MRRFLATVLLFAACLVTPLLRAQSDPFGTLMEKGEADFKHSRFDDAVKSFKKAAKLQPKEAVPLLDLSTCYIELKAFRDAEEMARKALPLATSNQEKARAHAAIGLAVARASDNSGKDEKRLREATEEFGAAVQLQPTTSRYQFELGECLLRLHRDDEGTAVLKKLLETSPGCPEATLAGGLIEQPRRARESFAPDFTATTLDGRYISSDDFRGKVLLLDFWATWCPPCVQAVPDIKRFAKKWANDPVVIVSISGDQDEEKWRAFVAKNKMDWIQVYDKNHIGRSFNVHAIPHFFVIDEEGIIRREIEGASNFQEVVLEDEIKKELKAMKKKAQAAPPSSATNPSPTPSN